MYNNRSRSKGSRFGHGQRRPPHNRFAQKKRGPQNGQYIDPSRFVNKAVITEEVEHFVPEHQFSDFAIDAELKQAVVSKGYVTPTPIQDRAIPHVLKGSDVVGIANTGTGKTAAFLIPLIDKVRRDPKAQVLVVVPTRELAIQIETELKGFTKGLTAPGGKKNLLGRVCGWRLYWPTAPRA
jgi:superfamily II DNA/RNA helicase